MPPEPYSFSARALLFDMDGTLVDSHEVVEAAWRDISERLGLDFDALLKVIHGVRAEDTLRRWAPPGTDLEAVAAELAEYEIREARRTRALPGAVAFLDAMPLSAHALVTSATLPLAVARMKGAGIRLPQLVVTAEDALRGKPAPDVYLLAAELLGVDPADAVVFEDAEAGIQAGLAAGMRVIVVGKHRSDATVGLPRIRGYDGATVETREDGTLRVTLQPAEQEEPDEPGEKDGEGR
ncbi:HAD-IA family hydrolase [Naasia sp. SYSU D00057]|uniref:HAD-IA family hydrolase n=1 Tax=Naasia sp. SYSU D00057 TaxID=2817380 RepID=UPI0027DBB5ED|nr:HAD-IA family hydrolase [Naasia sp. SYSU D00057]